MSYSILIHHPHGTADHASAETRAEAQRIARAEKARNPRVTVTIERIAR